MSRLLLCSALLLTTIACAGDDADKSSETEETEDTQATESDSEPDGEALYSTHCASCHGDDGTGGSERGIEGELHHSDEELIDVILNGDGEMPGINVTEEEAQAIVDWMRASF